MNKPGRVLFGVGGIYEYDNGVITYKSSGFSGASVSDMTFNKKGEIFFVVVDSKGFYSESGTFDENGNYPTVKPIGRTDKSLTFTKAVFDPNDDNHVMGYIGTNNGNPDFDGVKESFDRGKTWSDYLGITKQETTIAEGMAVGNDRSTPHAVDLVLDLLLEKRIDLPVVEVTLVVLGTLDILARLDHLAHAVGLRLRKAIGIGLRGAGLVSGVQGIQLVLNHFVEGRLRPTGCDDGIDRLLSKRHPGKSKGYERCEKALMYRQNHRFKFS